jgi:salicylate 5-hydroxylase large subunit
VEAAERRWPEQGVTRVPYWVYADPEIYRLEQERIFRGPSWSYVGLAAEVPRPGDFTRSSLGELPVVLVRGRDEALHVLVNRCAHRGVQFCREPHGNAREFVCPYHQWTYDLAGHLVGVPFRRGLARQGGMPPDFELKDHGLERLRTTERHGVVFASCDEAAPPFDEYLGPAMLPYFDRVFDGRALSVLGHLRQRIPCNWKLMFENIKDPYHASLLHVFLVSFGLFRADNPSQTKMDATGMHSVLVSQRGAQRASVDTAEMRSFDESFRLEDPTLLTPVKEFPGDATVVMQTIWPNLIVQQQTNTLATRRIVPRGPRAFDLVWTFFGYADDTEEMTRIRLRQANLMGPAGFVSLDDSEVMKLSQRGIGPSPAASGVLEMGGSGTGDEDHIVTEAAIRAFYSHYRRVMGL